MQTVADMGKLEYQIASAEAMAADSTKQQDAPTYEDATALGVSLLHEFAQAENDRRPIEERWLKDLRQFRGIYDPEVLKKIGTNRSKAFVRKTRVKVVTTDSRIMDLQFPANTRRTFTLESTPVPSVPSEQVERLRAVLTKANGGTPPDEKTMLKAMRDAVTEAAKGMERTIDDQLVEAGYKAVAGKVIHSGNLYGTGVLKAPLVEKKVRTKYVHERGKWTLKTEEYIVPFVDFVPLWRFYPDMAAVNIEDCRYVYERHTMSKSAMLKLAERKSFNAQLIRGYVKSNPQGQVQLRYFDTELRVIGDRQSTNIQNVGQYEVLERWGYLDAEQLAAIGVKIPAHRMHETYFTNVWLLPNGQVIKAAIQPINGVTWPYHLYYFDKDETNIFGEGLAAVMRDDQTMLNAAVRMILDNAALTAGPQLEVNTSLLSKGEKAEDMFPFKIWPRSGIGEDSRSPAVRVLEIPNNMTQLQAIAAMFENNADEVTAIPRYLYGENPSGGAAGTMGGLSMLMGAASIVIKKLVSQYEEGVTKKFILALYRWNMQFNPNNNIKGDFDVNVTGVSSLVAKEVRAKQLDDFSTLAANPLDGPYIKRDVLLRQRAEAHELTDVVKTEDEVQEDMNSPAAQAQQQLAQAQQQLAVAELEGKVAKLAAEVNRLNADAVSKNVGSAYSAMQAGAVVAQSPGIAPAGDEILRSSGWRDGTPAQGTPQPAQQEAAVPPPDGPHDGMQTGIETQRTSDGAYA